MKKKSPIRTFSTCAAVALMSLAFIHCGEETAGPSGPDPDPTPNALKDSADTARYMHSLYKGKWKPLKILSVQPGIDTIDRTESIEFLLYLDSMIVQEIPDQNPTVDDTTHYRVSRDSICVSSYGGNFLDWSCTSHAFKGKDTLDYSDPINTEIWIRSK